MEDTIESCIIIVRSRTKLVDASQYIQQVGDQRMLKYISAAGHVIRDSGPFQGLCKVSAQRMLGIQDRKRSFDFLFMPTPDLVEYICILVGLAWIGLDLHGLVMTCIDARAPDDFFLAVNALDSTGTH